jgi:2'-5' RNA ligase
VSADGRKPSQRVFFASWPDAATRMALCAAAGPQLAGAGRAVPADNLHLTLEFLGNMPTAQLEQLLGIGATLAWPAAIVLLDRLDWWPRARVLVAASTTPSGALLGLEAELRGRLGAAGYRLDVQPFRPHVTLARDVPGTPAMTLDTPVPWPLLELALVASEPAPGASRYRVLARWTGGA